MNPVLVRHGDNDDILRTKWSVHELVARLLEAQNPPQFAVHQLTGHCELPSKKSCRTSKQICDRKEQMRYCKHIGECPYKVPFFDVDGLFSSVT